MSESSSKPIRDILPIFVVAQTQPVGVSAFCGTGFLAADELLVTCSHCVSATLPPGHRFAVAYLDPGQNRYRVAYLDDVSEDVNSTDLATARVPLKNEFALELSEEDPSYGTDVWSFGYPLIEARPKDGQLPHFTLHGRYLQGYVMRSFFYNHPSRGRVASYELDMPTPAGLSGAPLVRIGSRKVLGVVYGTHDVSTVEEWATVDPQTGQRTPELHRVASFGLAHYTSTLRNLTGRATDGLPLAEYLAKNGAA